MKKGFKLPPRKTIINIVLLTFILVFNRLSVVRNFPDDAMPFVLERDITLVSANDGERSIASLHKGETVKYLGVIDGNEYCPCGLVVETSSGERGLLSSLRLGYPLYFTEADHDTCRVYVQRQFTDKHGKKQLAVKTSLGEKKDVPLDAIRPVLPESMRMQMLHRSGDYYMSQKKFERLYLGATIAENDARYRPAMHIDKSSKGWEAYYPNLEVFVWDDFCFRNPIITYNTNGVAVSYKWDRTMTVPENWSGLLYLPAPYIIDFDFVARIIESSIYGVYGRGNERNYSEAHFSDDNPAPIGRVVLIFIFLFFGCIWIFMTATLPMYLLHASLYLCRYLFYHLPDIVVKILFVLIGLFSMFCWLVLMVVWGCWSFVLPIIMIVCLIAIWRSTRELCKKPHVRCQHCRRMGTMKFLTTEYGRSSTFHEGETRTTDSNTVVTGHTWTERTVHEPYAIQKYIVDKKTHTQTTTKYDDFEVEYSLTPKVDKYRCTCCGHVEELRSIMKLEHSRQKVGSHTEVTHDVR